MKSLPILLALAVFSAPALGAAPAPVNPHGDMQKPAAGAPGAANPHAGMHKSGEGAPEAPLPQKAKVLSTIDVPQYTYLEVALNNKPVWLAAGTVAVKKGDVVRFDNGMEMRNFQSKTLNRTFPSIIFVSRVVVTNEKE